MLLVDALDRLHLSGAVLIDHRLLDRPPDEGLDRAVDAAVDAVRLVPLAECRRLLAVAREGGEVEVVRDGGAVGELLILQLPPH